MDADLLYLYLICVSEVGLQLLLSDNDRLCLNFCYLGLHGEQVTVISALPVSQSERAGCSILSRSFSVISSSLWNEFWWRRWTNYSVSCSFSTPAKFHLRQWSGTLSISRGKPSTEIFYWWKESCVRGWRLFCLCFWVLFYCIYEIHQVLSTHFRPAPWEVNSIFVCMCMSIFLCVCVCVQNMTTTAAIAFFFRCFQAVSPSSSRLLACFPFTFFPTCFSLFSHLSGI